MDKNTSAGKPEQPAQDKKEDFAHSRHPFRDKLTAAALLAGVLAISAWVGYEGSEGRITIWLVFVAASITALTTGFGAFPFLFTKSVEKSWLGYGNAMAAGLMLGASLGLLWEGIGISDVANPAWRTAAGAVTGVVLVWLAQKALANRDDDFSIGEVQGAGAVKMLLIVGIMTVHSFAEGIGVGVSYGENPNFGIFITMAIAVHNIPEGLAISLILIPRGSSVRAAAGWSIFSSLPQPLMAVPAFLFVLTFKQFLPFGLGLAAGAMLWMVAYELLPDAKAELSAARVYAMTFIMTLGMMAFQFLVH